MTTHRHYLILLALLAGGISVAGCSSTPSKTTPSRPASTATTTAATSGTTKAKTPATSPATLKALPDNTGIPACDDYLSSYMACHRAAGIYAQDQIPAHYQEMRESLLRDSQNPAVRPELGARCTSLAQQLKDALHGKSCGPTSPASTGSSSSR